MFLQDSTKVVIRRNVDRLAVKFVLNRAGFESSIRDERTADILSKLLDIEVPVGLSAIILDSGDVLYVFQLGIILAEGQVLSKEEVLDLYNKGKASFVMVEVV
jgi:hypothetical protein